MNYYEFALLVHLLGVVFGLGGATVSDVLFLKSLKDERITPKEKSFLEGASLVIWMGILLLLLSGAFMFWKNWEVLSGQARMQAHVTIAAIVIANGLLFNIYTIPKISFWSEEKKKRQEVVGEYRRIRKIAFVQGAVSLLSWYSVFALGIARRFALPSVSYVEIVLVYIVILAAAVLVALLIEHISWKKHLKIPI